jgi:Fe-S cluster assembly ATPase SufC
VHLDHAKHGHVLCSILPVKDVDVVALCVPSGRVIRVTGWCGAGERGVERYHEGANTYVWSSGGISLQIQSTTKS